MKYGLGARFPQVRLRATDGPLAPRTLTFEEPDVFVFGRDPSVAALTQLPESDPTASRFHFVLEVSPPHARLRDLGSLNGTKVNGLVHGRRLPNESPEQARQREQDAVTLKPGDAISAGAHKFVFEADAPPPQPTVAAGPVPTVLAEPEDTAQQETVWPTGGADAGAAAPTIADYTWDREKDLLGEGGMGAVYRARHRRTGALAAVKLLKAQGALTPVVVDLFRRELRLHAELVHPNIVRMMDAGAMGEEFYALMELCPGGSLESLRERSGGYLPVDLAVSKIKAAALGLAQIHRNEMIHRDIKPDNILLDGDGIAKISDFGLAKSLQRSVGFASKSGFVAGTFEFMPYEQLVNYKRVGKPADVFALAASLYVLITGRAPRPRGQNEQPVAPITRDAVPLATAMPAAPRALASLVNRSLSRDPSKRPPDAGAFHEELSLITNVGGGQPR